MTQVIQELIIPCCDVWTKNTLTPEKMHAYRVLNDQNEIRMGECIYSKAAGIVTVTYMSGLPHEWILQRLKQVSDQLLNKQVYTQERLDENV